MWSHFVWSLLGLLWLALAGLVGVNAGQQGRSAVLWFVLAVLISPPLAGLLVRAFGRADSFKLELGEPLMPPARAFQPDASYGEIPYKVNDTGSIDAVLAGTVVRFLNVDEFLAAVARPVNRRLPPISQMRSSAAGPKSPPRGPQPARHIDERIDAIIGILSEYQRTRTSN
jgi:hypothetical protein